MMTETGTKIREGKLWQSMMDRKVFVRVGTLEMGRTPITTT